MSAKCKVCSKSVYPMDPQINLDGIKFHKPCAKCSDCGCQITVSNFTKNESGDQTVLLCKIYYFKRFHEGGSYLGGDKFKVKADRDMKGSSSSSPVPTSPVGGASTPITPTDTKQTVFNMPQTEVTTPIESAPVAKPEAEVEAPAVETTSTADTTTEDKSPAPIPASTDEDTPSHAAAVESTSVSSESEAVADSGLVEDMGNVAIDENPSSEN